MRLLAAAGGAEAALRYGVHAVAPAAGSPEAQQAEQEQERGPQQQQQQEQQQEQQQGEGEGEGALAPWASGGTASGHSHGGINGSSSGTSKSVSRLPAPTSARIWEDVVEAAGGPLGNLSMVSLRH